MDQSVKYQSLLSVANSSANTLAALVSQGSSLAVADVSTFPHDNQSMFSASSMMTSIDCKAVPKCFPTATAGTTANCTVNGQTFNSTTPGIFGAPLYDEYGAIPNPFQFLYWFKMDASGDSPPSFNDPTAPDVWFSPNGPINNPVIATLCNVSVQDANFTWSGGSYTIDAVSPASGFVAGAVFGPMVETTAASVLSGQIEVLALTAPSVSDYERGLSDILANGMISRASGLLMPVSTTTSVTFSNLLITQYPVVPLFILLLLLYVYALLAVSLMVAAMLTRSSPITLDEADGGSRTVSTLVLAQRSIVSPLSIIAAMFAREQLGREEGGKRHDDKDNGNGGAAAAACARASVALEDAHLFDPSEHTSMTPRRVVLGLGGGDAAQPAFGLWLASEEENTESRLRDPTPFQGFEAHSG